MNSRKALDRWARTTGYSDFDTYIRVGGSIIEARNEILERIAMLQAALAACNDERLPDGPLPRNHIPIRADVAEADLPDPENAHPQGGEAA